MEEQQEHQLNLGLIQRKLHEGFVYIERAKDRNLVLLIGNTGVGKSTTGNYMLGHKMIRRKITLPNTDGYRMVVDVGDPPPSFPIGDTLEATTLYASPVSGEGVEWTLTDCPGFLGNKSIEDRVIESISTELTIRNARQIKAIAIFIDWPSIQATKMQEFHKLIKTLTTLFRDPVALIDQTFFIVTQLRGVDTEEALGEFQCKVGQLIQLCEERISRLENGGLGDIEGLLPEDYARMSAYLRAIQPKLGEVVFIDPLDQGQSRQLINARINAIRVIEPITIRDFNFEWYDENRSKFNLAIYDLAYNGLRLISGLENIQREISIKRKDVCHHEEAVKLSTKLLEQLKRPKVETVKWKEIGRDIIEKHKMSVSSLLKRKLLRIEQIEREYAMIESILRKVDVDTLMVYRELHVNRELHAGRELHEHKHKHKKKDKRKDKRKHKHPEREKKDCIQQRYDFEVRLEGGAPLFIEEHCENGEFSDRCNQAATGYYKVTYKAHKGSRREKADIIARCRIRDEPGNRRLIEVYRAKLAEDRTELALKKEMNLGENRSISEEICSLKQVISKEIANLKQSIKSIQEKIDHENSDRGDAESQVLNQVKVFEMQEKIDEKNKAIEDNKARIQALTEEGLELLRQFTSNQSLYDVIPKLSALIDFPSLIVEMFLARFTVFNLPQCIDVIRGSGILENMDFPEILPSIRVGKNPEKKPRSGAKDLSISLGFQRALTDAIEKWAVAKAVADLDYTVSGELHKEANKWGFTCKDMAHDGNCFFHAVADQLILQNRTDLDHKKLRELTVDHIIRNWNSYKETVDQDPGAFVEKISKDGTWADHQMILALSRILDMNLVIIRSDHAEPQIFKRVSATATLYIGYEVGRHYQSLIVDPRVVNPRSIQNVINRITPDLWGAADVVPVRAPAAPVSSFGESPERTQRGEVYNLQQESEKNGRNVRRKHSRWDKASDNTLAPSKPAIASSSSPSSTDSSSDTVSPKHPKYASSAPNTDEVDLTVSLPGSPQKTQVNPSHVLGSMFYLPSAAIPVKNEDSRLNNNSTGIIASSSVVSNNPYDRLDSKRRELSQLKEERTNLLKEIAQHGKKLTSQIEQQLTDLNAKILKLEDEITQLEEAGSSVMHLANKF